MDSTTASLLPRTSVRTKGFSLIELMIAVVIVAILAAVAYPSYIEYVYKGRRGDATSSLLRIQQAQERWRGTNTTYTANISDLAPYGVTATSEKGYYDLALIPPSTANSYTAKATAKTGDSKCTSLTVAMSNGTITYGSTGTGTSGFVANFNLASKVASGPR